MNFVLNFVLLALPAITFCHEDLVASQCGSLLSPRYGASAIYDGNDSIYVLGGARHVQNGTHSQLLNEVVQYDL